MCTFDAVERHGRASDATTQGNKPHTLSDANTTATASLQSLPEAAPGRERATAARLRTSADRMDQLEQFWAAVSDTTAAIAFREERLAGAAQRAEEQRAVRVRDTWWEDGSQWHRDVADGSSGGDAHW